MTNIALRVGIFGGGFDPVHKGHIEVVHSLLASQLMHEVWVMPVESPPHKDRDLVDFNHRFRMLELAFEEEIRQGVVRISDYERFLAAPNYSVQTVRYLIEEFPDHQFFLCLGSDSLATIHLWHKYEELLELITPVVANRPGYDKHPVSEQVLEKAVFIDHTEVQISSTTVRRSKSTGIWSGEHEDLPDPVSEYIEVHNLYSKGS